MIRKWQKSFYAGFFFFTCIVGTVFFVGDTKQRFNQLSNLLREDLAYIVRNIFHYQSISLEGLSHYSEDELRHLIRADSVISWWDAPPEELEQRLRKISWIETAEAKTSFFPLKVRLKVREAAPWFVAELAEGSWLISRRGKMLQPLDTIVRSELVMTVSQLPRVGGLGSDAGESSLKLEQFVKQIQFFDEIGGLPFPIERYVVLPSGAIEADFANVVDEKLPLKRVRFFVRNKEEAQENLSRIESVVDDLRRRGEVADIADLRFNSQVVVNLEKARTPSF